MADEDTFLYGDNDPTKMVEVEPAVASAAPPTPLPHDDEPVAQKQGEIVILTDGENDDDSDDDKIEVIADFKTITNPTTNSAPLQTHKPQDHDSSTAQAGKLNLNAPAHINGKPIFEASLDEVEDKPWRLPGADLTDYFNYGFTEETWGMYCRKQKEFRHFFAEGNMSGGNLQQILTNRERPIQTLGAGSGPRPSVPAATMRNTAAENKPDSGQKIETLNTAEKPPLLHMPNAGPPPQQQQQQMSRPMFPMRPMQNPSMANFAPLLGPQFQPNQFRPGMPPPGPFQGFPPGPMGPPPPGFLFGPNGPQKGNLPMNLLGPNFQMGPPSGNMPDANTSGPGERDDNNEDGSGSDPEQSSSRRSKRDRDGEKKKHRKRSRSRERDHKSSKRDRSSRRKRSRSP